jgi:predicted tellurium resistance membrane protein TerC
VVSIPLIVWGSQLVLKLLDRYPIVVTFGAALLGWIAGGLIINDPAGDRWPILDTPAAEYGMSVAGAVFVLILGYLLKRRNANRATA